MRYVIANGNGSITPDHIWEDYDESYREQYDDFKRYDIGDYPVKIRTSFIEDSGMIVELIDDEFLMKPYGEKI